MTDQKTTCLKAETQQQEPILILGMIGIVNQAGIFVQEDRFRLFKGHAMLNEVGFGFAAVPGKFDIAYSIILALWEPASDRHFRILGLLDHLLPWSERFPSTKSPNWSKLKLLSAKQILEDPQA
jgi:hypothetical protein